MAERPIAPPPLQRARIVHAMASSVGERGYASTTVAAVCAEAKVSRATFYATFDGLQDCFLAVIDDAQACARRLISAAFADAEDWREGMRLALASLLSLFDGEPLLARVWFVETLAAGAWALERRREHVAALTSMIVARWPLPQHAQVNRLAPAAVMESLLGVIHSHLLARRTEPLISLLGPMMGFIAAQYLGPRAARREIERAENLGDSMITQREATSERDATRGVVRPDAIPALLCDPRAHRARECVRYLAHHPGASNRQIARAAGIARDTQISAVLRRLALLGLLDRGERRPGEANAWSLTPFGMRMATSLEHGASVSGGDCSEGGASAA